MDNDYIVEGANDIGREIYGSKFDPKKHRRRVFYMLEKGYLRAWKIGKIWATTASAIAAFKRGENAGKVA